MTMNRDAASSSNARRKRSASHIPDFGTRAAAPSSPCHNGKRPMARSEADKATSRSSQRSADQLLTNSDSQKEESKLRASRRIVKRKHICCTCEPDKNNERRANASQSTKANNLCQTSSNHAGPKRSSIKARRKLILDSSQGATHKMHSMRAPRISGALGDNAATEKQRKCTPKALVHEQHASDTHFRRAETRLMRSKQNPNKKAISGHQSEPAGENTVSRGQQTPPVSGKHVAAAPARTAAGKRARGGIPVSEVTRNAKKLPNATQRKLARYEVCTMGNCGNSLEQHGAEETGSSKACVTQNKKSAKSRKPSEFGTQCTPKTGSRKQSKSIARAGPSRSQSRGSKSSNQDSKPTTAAKRTKSLQEITNGRAARKRNAQVNAPSNRQVCDDMYQCKDVAAGKIPNYFLEQEHWEQLSDIVTPRMGTPPPNSPHLSPGRAQSLNSSFSSVPYARSRANAIAIMRSIRKRKVKAAALPCSTPKKVKRLNRKCLSFSPQNTVSVKIAK